jgi:hypothetical protein
MSSAALLSRTQSASSIVALPLEPPSEHAPFSLSCAVKTAI